MIGQAKTIGCQQPESAQLTEGVHSSKPAGNLSEIRINLFKNKYFLPHNTDFLYDTKHVNNLF